VSRGAIEAARLRLWGDVEAKFAISCESPYDVFRDLIRIAPHVILDNLTPVLSETLRLIPLLAH
jgi:hypothetical protein